MIHPELLDTFPGAPRQQHAGSPRFEPRPGVVDGRVRIALIGQLAAYLDERRALGYQRLVIGLSGGLDSTVGLHLAQEAVGESVHAVVVDLGDNPVETQLGSHLAELLGVECTTIDGQAMLQALEQAVPTTTALSRIHARSRLITTLIHQVADGIDGLVIDTTDRSEKLLHLFEEGRRGHVAPLAGLFKSELAAMLDHYGPHQLAPSGCPELDNLEAFGVPWPTLDWITESLLNSGDHQVIVDAAGVDRDWVDRLHRRMTRQPLRTQAQGLTIPRFT